jgi:hypothetical protein
MLSIGLSEKKWKRRASLDSMLLFPVREKRFAYWRRMPSGRRIMPSTPRGRSFLEFPVLFSSSEAIFRCFVNRVELEAVVIEA